MMNVLEVRNLYKSFKKSFWSSRVRILKGLSFSIPKGSAVGFLGANGSGKTTTFKCILDLIKKDSGSVSFFGEDISLKVRSRIGFLPERPQFYEELTAWEVLCFYLSLNKPLSPLLKQHIIEKLKQMHLYEWKDSKLKTFSKGMIQKIGLLQSLIHKPDFLILDEPFSGLDPESRFVVMEILEQMKQEGCTLFLSSHIFQDVERLCDSLIILKEGCLVFEGAFSDLKRVQSEKYNLIYLLSDKKHNFTASSYEESQTELKKILSKGASVLSFQRAGGSLEQQYQELMKEKKE